MSYTLIIEKAALKALKKLPANLKQRIANKLSELATDPLTEHLDIKALAGRENEYRLRVGDWRVIYELHHDRLVIRVLTITSRGGAYKQ
ncbi:MAG: type II toxin-antitoxin system RelE/ParE family toxin [Caldilineaceae bacterium]|nr:type II toxin-antitoxin system RelE/ParE family toxin [Caldilineaceae bacterium]